MCKQVYQKKYRLKDFLDAHWNKYTKNPIKFIEPEQYKAVNAIRTCQTEVLGVDYYVCPDCGEIKKIFHSCKNRFCPTCSWKDTLKWAEKISDNLLNIKHRHIVCTLPHSLNQLIKDNKKQMLNIVFQASAETFKDWFLAKYKIKTAIISVLHTFGEKKNWHTHTHQIVAWGGIHQQTGKLVEIKEEFVNYKFLAQKFRIKYENKLLKLFDSNILKHKYKNRIEFLMFLENINLQDWIIHLEPAMKTSEKIIRYIGRYSKRACISEYKITNIENEYITFRYKDYKDRNKDNKPKEKLLTLHYNDFFPRLLQHVPLPYFRIVRYYGLYAPNVNIPAKYLEKKTEKNVSITTDYNSSKNCSTCKIPMKYLYTIMDTRPKQNRTQIFDLSAHRHVKFKNIS